MRASQITTDQLATISTQTNRARPVNERTRHHKTTQAHRDAVARRHATPPPKATRTRLTTNVPNSLDYLAWIRATINATNRYRP